MIYVAIKDYSGLGIVNEPTSSSFLHSCIDFLAKSGQRLDILDETTAYLIFTIRAHQIGGVVSPTDAYQVANLKSNKVTPQFSPKYFEQLRCNFL